MPGTGGTEGLFFFEAWLLIVPHPKLALGTLTAVRPALASVAHSLGFFCAVLRLCPVLRPRRRSLDCPNSQTAPPGRDRLPVIVEVTGIVPSDRAMVLIPPSPVFFSPGAARCDGFPNISESPLNRTLVAISSRIRPTPIAVCPIKSASPLPETSFPVVSRDRMFRSLRLSPGAFPFLSQNTRLPQCPGRIFGTPGWSFPNNLPQSRPSWGCRSLMTFFDSLLPFGREIL